MGQYKRRPPIENYNQLNSKKMTQAAIDQALKIRDWESMFLGSFYSEPSMDNFADFMMDVTLERPFGVSMNMETPVKLKGFMSSNIPKYKVDRVGPTDD